MSRILVLLISGSSRTTFDENFNHVSEYILMNFTIYRRPKFRQMWNEFSTFEIQFKPRHSIVHKYATKCRYKLYFSANAAADKITSLPGLDKLPAFDMYSGYLNITGRVHRKGFVRSNNLIIIVWVCTVRT